MGANLALYESVMGSNLSAPEKTQFRRTFERLSGGAVNALEIARDRGIGPVRGSHIAATLDVVRQGGETSVTAAGLAALYVHFGLDWKGIPADATLAALMSVGSIVSAGTEKSTTARNIGASALSVYLFRQTARLLAMKMQKSGGTPVGSTMAGESSEEAEDPILAAAKRF